MVFLYNTVIEKAFKTLSNEAREAFMLTKKAADEIKSEVAAKEGYIKESDIARLLKFRSNPSDESWREM